MEADNHQATVMNILVTHESMDYKTAYNIVKTIFDRKDGKPPRWPTFGMKLSAKPNSAMKLRLRSAGPLTSPRL